MLRKSSFVKSAEVLDILRFHAEAHMEAQPIHLTTKGKLQLENSTQRLEISLAAKILTQRLEFSLTEVSNCR